MRSPSGRVIGPSPAASLAAAPSTTPRVPRSIHHAAVEQSDAAQHVYRPGELIVVGGSHDRRVDRALLGRALVLGLVVLGLVLLVARLCSLVVLGLAILLRRVLDLG